MLEGGIQDKARQRDILKFLEHWRMMDTVSKFDFVSEHICKPIPTGVDTEFHASPELFVVTTLDCLAVNPDKFNEAIMGVSY